MIGVVACSKSKLAAPARADALYTGRTFRAAAALLRARGCDRLVILSAEHGPVEASAVLAPYERTLVGARRAELDAWAADAAPRLRAMAGAEPVLAIVPEGYAGALRELPDATRLFAGLTQGRLFSAVSLALAEAQRAAASTTTATASDEGL